jgi:uncharacterized damage-inducible protein DinB
MVLAHVHTLFEYHYWAYELIFAQVEKLTKEQFTAQREFPHGGVQSTLAHLLLAEVIWRKRLTDNSPDRRWFVDFTREKREADFAALRKDFAREMVAMQAFLDTLKENDLIKEWSYTDSRGNPYQAELIGLLTHLVLHGMQHRAELAQMLTQFEHSPGDIDYLFWMREED